MKMGRLVGPITYRCVPCKSMDPLHERSEQNVISSIKNHMQQLPRDIVSVCRLLHNKMASVIPSCLDSDSPAD